MSRSEEARGPIPDATADWYRGFEAELTTRGLPASEVVRMVTSTRAEAEAAGVQPKDLYGPAVLYAREVASALRDYQATASVPAGLATGNIDDVGTAGLIDVVDRDDPVGTVRREPASADTPISTAQSKGPMVLHLTDVSARRGRRTVLSGINLTVRQGEVVAVVGANGAGKSTCSSSAQVAARERRTHRENTALRLCASARLPRAATDGRRAPPALRCGAQHAPAPVGLDRSPAPEPPGLDR